MDYAYYAFDTPEELEAMREKLKIELITRPSIRSYNTNENEEFTYASRVISLKAYCHEILLMLSGLKVPENEIVSFRGYEYAVKYISIRMQLMTKYC